MKKHTFLKVNDNFTLYIKITRLHKNILPWALFLLKGSLDFDHVHNIKFFLGSEGKLVVASQRISMLSGIGDMSHATVTGSSVQDMAGDIALMFVPLLKQEGKQWKYSKYESETSASDIQVS